MKSIRSVNFSFIVFFLLITLPTLSVGFLNASSYAQGILLFDIVFLTLVLFRYKRGIVFKNKNSLSKLILVAFILLLHGIFVSIIFDSDLNYSKFIVSYLGIIITSISAYCFGNLILNFPSHTLSKYVRNIILFLIFNVLLSIFGINLFSGWNPVGIYQEPSHVSILVAPFLIFSSVTRLKYNLLFLTLFFLWGVFYKNLTILLIVTFSSLFYLSSYKKFVVVFLSTLLIFFISIPLVKSEYFSSRLNFSTNTTNGSVLVLIRGWEDAKEALQKTNGIGIGFQELGYSKLLSYSGDAHYMLEKINLPDLNRFDGGTLSPKLIAELGFLGVFVLLIYVKLFFRVLKNLFSHAKTSNILFLQCCYLGVFFQFFIRGAGYFTIGSFLLLAAVLNLSFHKSNNYE